MLKKLKKLFFHPLAGLGYVVSLSWLCIRLSGQPRTPLELLGALSLASLAALAVFFLIASVRYRPEAGDSGAGVLSTLVLCLGAVIIASTLVASAFGTSAALTYAGAAAIAAVATLAMTAIAKDGR